MRWILFRFRRLITNSEPQYRSYIPSRGCKIYRLGNHAYVIYREQFIDPQIVNVDATLTSNKDEIKLPTQTLGDIFLYYVLRQRRGYGVAKVLFNYLIKRIKHVSEWACEVAVTNHRSIMALLRAGFHRQATRKAYYESNIPAILLKLSAGTLNNHNRKINRAH